MTIVREAQTGTREVEAAGTGLGLLDRRFPRAKWMLPLVVLVLVLHGLHVWAYPRISPFDEYAHIDSTIRASRGQFFVQPDDKLTQQTLSEVACRGSEYTSFPRCKHGGRYDAKTFVWKGYNQASSYPPWYYAATGLVARVPSAVFGGLVTWARLLGALWVLVGVYLVIRAGEYLGVDRRWLAVALALVIASPALLHSTNTVTPDGSGFAAGAAVLVAVLAWERDRRSLWLVALAGFVCASLKDTHVIGVAIMLVYIALRAVASATGNGSEEARPPRDYLRAGFTLAGAAAAAIFGWKIAYRLLARDVDLSGSPSQRAFHVNHLKAVFVFGRDTVLGIFPPIDGYLPGTLGRTQYVVFAGAAVLLVLGVLALFAFRYRLADRRIGALGAATVVALVVAPPLFILYNYLADSLFYVLLTRQALSALPAIALLLAAAAARSLPGRVLLGLVAAGLCLSAISALL
jgi:hypothetical protein